MTETFNEIVTNCYEKLHNNFTTSLMKRYRGANLRLEDAENIYQDVFVAIHENIEKGGVRPNTNWKTYIQVVGNNIASKLFNRTLKDLDYIDETDAVNSDELSAKAFRIREEMEKDAEEEYCLYRDPEAHRLLKEQINALPEVSGRIIRLSYFSDMTDKEIAEVLEPYSTNGKSAEVNAKAIRARRWVIMRELEKKVKHAFYAAELISEMPNQASRGKAA